MDKRKKEAIYAIYIEALKNKVIVTSFDKALQEVNNAEKPTLVIIQTLSLGAEHKSLISDLVESGLEKKVVVQFDEADLIQTKEQRAKNVIGKIHGSSKISEFKAT